MKVRIENILPKKVVGNKIIFKISQSAEKIPTLWQQFMPKKHLIKNKVNTNTLSILVSETKIGFSKIDPNQVIERWAGLEVYDFSDIPDSMEEITLKGGLYAVFAHKGNAANFRITMKQVLDNWLPDSGYEIDIREQFEILPEGYNFTNPNAEEEVWLPVKKL